MSNLNELNNQLRPHASLAMPVNGIECRDKATIVIVENIKPEVGAGNAVQTGTVLRKIASVLFCS